MTRTGLIIRILILAGGMVLTAALSAWVAFTFLTRGGEVIVPNLVGAEIRAALELTGRAQLGLRVAGTGHDAGTPPGHVISQDPAPGNRTRRNRIVHVILSQGTPTVFVPKLRGLTLRRAELQLTEAGLRLGKVGHAHHEGVPEGAVITQVPAPGQFVERGQDVSLLLSDGALPAVYLMPDLTGFSLETVLGNIRAMNLLSGRIREVVSEELPPGTVTEISPKPGSAVSEGQNVHLTVTRARAPATPASLVLFQYTSPPGLLERTLTLVLDTGEEEKTLWEDVVQPGTSVSIPVSVSSPGILRAYLDGAFLEERQVP